MNSILGGIGLRLDYTLYVIAAMVFVATGMALGYQVAYKELWVISTVVLGLTFVGLGYLQRPKARPIAVEASTPISSVQSTPLPAITDPGVPSLVATSQQSQETAETVVAQEGTAGAPSKTISLTDVKGIGEKRAERLRSIGINTVEELARASAEDLAAKLKVSPRMAMTLIENAKKLIEKS